MTNPNAPIFGLLSSRIGATFTGTSLSAIFTGTGTNLFNVVIDNQNAIVITVPPTTTPTVFPITHTLTGGAHTVWMTKRTEFLQSDGTESVGSVQFFGFTLDPNGAFGTPPATQTRRIEFSGDSGFTGFGADAVMTGGASYCSYTPETQNADKSIPAYTGALLNADIINDSSSGQAVYHSVYDNNPNHLLTAMFYETNPPLQAPAWNFNGWIPDVVVLDAGGDDLTGSAGSGKFPNPNAFITTYEQWLTQIRLFYPNATIVLVLSQSAASQDIATLGGALQQVVAARNAAADANVYYYDYFTSDPNYVTYDTMATGMKVYWGCSYHPSAAGAQVLGERLATFIAQKMNW